MSNIEDSEASLPEIKADPISKCCEAVEVMALNTSRIELLSKDNFDTWSMQVEALLIKNDLWEYVNGSNLMPAETDTAAKSVWLKADKKARADLVLAIQPSELKQVRGCETSREVWLKLESIYASKGPARKATLLKQLMLQKLDEGDDVKEHIAKFFDAVDKLESMNVQINGDLLSIMLLYSLPSTYENFRCAIESRDELPTAEVLKIKIIEESEARKQSAGNTVIAMAAKSHVQDKQSRQKFIKSKREFRCFKCGFLGHKARFCSAKRDSDDHGKESNNSKHSAYSADETYAAYHSAVEEKFLEDIRGRRAWILDSGCTAHLCGDKYMFKMMKMSPKAKLNLASQQASADVRGKGSVHLSVIGADGQRVAEFQNTLFVPELRTNLISVAQITNKGYKVTFTKDGAFVSNADGKITLTADRKGDLYYVRESSECAYVQPKCSELLKWHYRMGHLNAADLTKLVKDGIVPASDVGDMKQLIQCEVCILGKMSALPFNRGKGPCSEPLKVIHSDVVGPFREESIGRARYFVTFIDDCTRWCEIYLLRQKSDVFEAFKLYQSFMERQTGLKIKCLQSDNGREYLNNDFDKYLSESGIARRLSVPRTPEQNGVAERMNRTLLDMTRCLLLQSGLSNCFWSEAVATACYVRNRCPSRALGGKSPYECLNKEKPNVKHFRSFGSKVMVLDKLPDKNKLAPRCDEGVFVGYPRETKSYRVWIPKAHKIICARDVRFVSEQQLFSIPTNNINDLLVPLEIPEENNGECRKFVDFTHSQIDDIRSNEPTTGADCQVEEIRRAPGRPKLMRMGNRGRPRKMFRCRVNSEPSQKTACQDSDNDSADDNDVFVGIAEISLRDALCGPEREEWSDALECEVMNIIKNDTWDIVTIVDNKNIVGCRFVLTNKYGPDGNIERRKARLVAKGCGQKYGINYTDTYAPVARLESIRLLLALSTHFNLTIWQFDVVSAYLNGTLSEKVFMRVPDNLYDILKRLQIKFNKTGDVGSKASKMMNEIDKGGNACRLKRALYGLKQAGRQWYAELKSKLISMGLKPTENESCLFHGYFEKNLVLLLVYVDDLLIASSEVKIIHKLKQKLLKYFEIKDIGRANYCLGLEIHQKDGTISLKQSGYIQALLKKFGMSQCNPVATPSELNMNFDKNDTINEACPYRELIGALMYMSVSARPDIANTVSRLAQFVANPTKCHWNAAKRVLRYLAGTANKGLLYRKTDLPLIGYADADWGGCTTDRRSYTGYVFLLSGAVISWKSQKQRTVALSSTEAEYVSLAESAKEAVYLRSLLNEIGLQKLADATIYVDNRGAQCLANDPVFHARTKHIDIKHHFVRECISAGLFSLKHVSTQEMIADVMTKPLARANHEKCLTGLGLSI
uniref:Retrovirus-related Pol polyprotein from transposon TNT 1-94 n=1 Tax=Ceratitis capitata TaxID=7213 RepID=W8B6G9_CERCA